MGETHSRWTVREPVEYYNNDRPHQLLGGNASTPRAVEDVGDVVATPILGGLHHRHSRAALTESDVLSVGNVYPRNTSDNLGLYESQPSRPLRRAYGVFGRDNWASA
jgi:hypothetical protein